MSHRYTHDDAQKGRSLVLPGEYGSYGTSPLGSYAGFGGFNSLLIVD